VIELCPLLFVAFRKVDGKRCGTGKANASLLQVSLGKIRLLKFFRLMSVAPKLERKLPSSVRAIWIIVELPMITRAVVANRGGTKFSGNERRNKGAARLILPSN
jgi:hypothetical protein